MQIRFEYFATTSLLGGEESPPRQNGKMWFAQGWERQAFGMAIALSKKGHFEWEEFRQGLIQSIGEWEREYGTDGGAWNYYERWLIALERLAVQSGVIAPDEFERRVDAELADLRACDYTKRSDL